MDNKYLFIINPISGTRSKVDIPHLIDQIFNGESYAVAFTEYPGHASILASKAVAEGLKAVIAVGGDGTINEVARSLINSETALGIIPVGSGNGLARELGIPMQIKKALKTIHQGVIRKIDYGVANNHPFFCTCGVGFDARVSYKFAKDKKRGGLMYVKNVITEFLNYQPETYEILMDKDGIKEKAFLVTVANASQWGNNAFIAPDANMEDGKLNITLLKPFTYIDIPNLAVQLFTRMIDMNSHICTFEKDSITILRERPGVIHLDGEPMNMPERIEISTTAGGLMVFVPEKRVSFEDHLHRLVNQLVNEFPF